jgi:hypothetical protein
MSGGERLPIDDLVVVGSVEAANTGFFDVTLLRVKVSCPRVLVGRGSLDNQHLGNIRTCLLELAFDNAKELAPDSVPLAVRVRRR